MRKRKWDVKTTAVIVLEGLKGKPVADICHEHQISQSPYYQWQDQFLANAANAFERHQHTRVAGRNGQSPSPMPPPGSAGHGRVCRLQDPLRLLTGILVPKVPQELKEAQGPRQVGVTEATKHAQGGLAHGKQAFSLIRMALPMRLFLRRMLDEGMHVAHQRSLA